MYDTVGRNCVLLGFGTMSLRYVRQIHERLYPAASVDVDAPYVGFIISQTDGIARSPRTLTAVDIDDVLTRCYNILMLIVMVDQRDDAALATAISACKRANTACVTLSIALCAEPVDHSECLASEAENVDLLRPLVDAYITTWVSAVNHRLSRMPIRLASALVSSQGWGTIDTFTWCDITDVREVLVGHVAAYGHQVSIGDVRTWEAEAYFREILQSRTRPPRGVLLLIGCHPEDDYLQMAEAAYVAAKLALRTVYKDHAQGIYLAHDVYLSNELADQVEVITCLTLCPEV